MTLPSIAIIGHDGGNNALGRALALADLLDRSGRVRVLAFGTDLWPAARGERPVELLRPATTTVGIPSAAARLRSAIREADILVAVKPRAMSYGLAAVVRDGRPLVLDIDDLEHEFVRRRFGWMRQLVQPDLEPVTRLLERVRRPVAAVTVASRALQRRYGGAWIPHVRDRSQLALQATEQGPATRARLGLEGSFVVGFVGTIRPHKGLHTLSRAIGMLGEDARLLLAGDLGDERTMEDLRVLARGRLVTVTRPSLAEIGAVLGACDVVAIPQSRSIAAEYQSPAKLLDALAAGAPVVASDIGDARELLGGVGHLVAPDDPDALATALAGLRADPAARARLGEAARERSREAFSLDRWRLAMAGVVDPLANGIGLA